MSFISHSIREVIREMLQGQLVRLRAFESGDLETNHLFVNDEETTLLMYKGMPFPTSLNDEQQWLSQQSSYTRGEYQFAVENMDGDLVGRCGIVRLDWKNRVAELGMMIGRPYRGRGYGKEALSLVCDFCFQQLGCHRLKVSVLDFNEAAIACYTACGFVREGVLREEVFRNGTFHDVILMGRISPCS